MKVLLQLLLFLFPQPSANQHLLPEPGEELFVRLMSPMLLSGLAEGDTVAVPQLQSVADVQSGFLQKPSVEQISPDPQLLLLPHVPLQVLGAADGLTVGLAVGLTAGDSVGEGLGLTLGLGDGAGVAAH